MIKPNFVFFLFWKVFMRFNRKKSSVMPKIFLFGACALALGIFGAFSLKGAVMPLYNVPYRGCSVYNSNPGFVVMGVT